MIAGVLSRWRITAIVPKGASDLKSERLHHAQPFVGRNDDLAALGRWFAEKRGIVTIVGPPGMGKTSLARQFTSDRAACFCDLSEARDLGGFIAALARTLSLDVGPRVDPVGVLSDTLGGRGPLVVVLDNFEHLVESCANTVASLSARAPNLQFLVTSRERLRVSGEIVHELEPLSLPEGARIGESEAVQLFVEHARRLRRSFVLTDGAAPLIAEIVRHLDGIPLALELGAARMGVLGPKQLLSRLAERLDLLSSGRRDGRALQATLRGAIDGSWQMLAAHECTALAQASVFRGGFALEAAEAVLDLRPSPNALPLIDVLAALRDKSLLRAHPSTELPGDVRFSLYESIRAFSGEKLRASGDETRTLERHARHHLKRGAEWLARRFEDPNALKHLAEERENLVAVLERALGMRPPTSASAADALDALRILDPLLARRGPFDQHLEWLTAALAAIGDPPRVPAALHASTLMGRGRALLSRGRLGESQHDFQACLEIGRRANDERIGARGLLGVGIALHRQGKRKEAQAPLEHSRRFFAAAGECRREAMALAYLGATHHQEGRSQEARRDYAEALRLLAPSSSDDALTEATVHLRLASLELEEGRAEEARQAAAAAARLAKAAGGSARLGGLIEGTLALAAWSLGDLARAKASAETALHLFELARDRHNVAFAWAINAAISAERGQVDEAIERFARARAVLEHLGDRDGVCFVEILHGHLDLARARRARASGETLAALEHLSSARRCVEKATRDSADVRLALKILEHALESHPPPEAALLVAKDGRWFRAPRNHPVSLKRRVSLSRLLARLLEEHERAPGRPVSIDALIAAGWSGESMKPEAATHRAHVAFNTLRKLGLGKLLLSNREGYWLDPAVPIALSNDQLTEESDTDA